MRKKSPSSSPNKERDALTAEATNAAAPQKRATKLLHISEINSR